MTHGWLYWALLSAAFAALTAIFAKVGLKGIDPDYATLLRTFVIVGVLSLIVLITGKWTNPLAVDRRSLFFLVLSGLATGASWVCYFRALQLGQTTQVAPIDKLSLALVAIFALIFLGERPPAKDWFGIALIVVGVVVISFRR